MPRYSMPYFPYIGAAKPKGQPIGNLAVADKFKGPFDSAPTKFLMLHKGSPSSLYNGFEGTVTMLFEDIIENRPWHSSNDYANSTIHAALNGEFLSRLGFSPKEVRIPYRPGTSGTTVNSGANGLLAKMWLLGAREVGSDGTELSGMIADGTKLDYFLLGSSADAATRRIALMLSSAGYYWLRSVLSSAASVTTVMSSGHITTQSPAVSYGTRPAFVLPDTTLVSMEPDVDGYYTILGVA